MCRSESAQPALVNLSTPAELPNTKRKLDRNERREEKGESNVESDALLCRDRFEMIIHIVIIMSG